MSKKEKKIIDIAKSIRRVGYKTQEFFKYRLMVASKHVLVVGGHNNPLKPLLYKAFQENWRIVQLSAHEEVECKPNLQLNVQDSMADLYEKAKAYSKYYESIIILEDMHTEVPQDLLTYQMRAALIGANLATKLLTGNGFLCFTVPEDSYFERYSSPVGQLIKDCQLQHLALNLGERDDLPDDSLILTLLRREEIQTDLVKYVKLWADGIKRPSSGTFVQFKLSDHKKPIVYPELL